jgi:hypothetical protein
MYFGIDCTGCNSLIRNKLKVVKHAVWDMTHPSMDVVALINNKKLLFQLFYYFYNDLCHLPLLYLFKLI